MAFSFFAASVHSFNMLFFLGPLNLSEDVQKPDDDHSLPSIAPSRVWHRCPWWKGET